MIKLEKIKQEKGGGEDYIKYTVFCMGLEFNLL